MLDDPGSELAEYAAFVVGLSDGFVYCDKMASEPLRHAAREDAEPSCRVYRDYLMACRHSLSADFGHSIRN